MKPIPIGAARSIGEKNGAERVVIITLDGGDYCITTWGRTRADCRALAKWSGSDAAVDAVRAVSDATPPA